MLEASILTVRRVTGSEVEKLEETLLVRVETELSKANTCFSIQMDTDIDK